MEFAYEHQGNNNFLVYRLSPEEQIDTFSLGMLRNNQIDGILPIAYTQIDDQRLIKYNISSKVSVQQFFAGVVTKKRLLGVFEGICDALLLAEDYMLPTNMFAVDLEHLDNVYASVSTCRAEVILLPVIGYDNHIRDWGNLFKSIIFTNRFDQEENNDYVAKIISFLNGNVSFSAEAFKRLIKELNTDTIYQNVQLNAAHSSKNAERQINVSDESEQNVIAHPAVQAGIKKNDAAGYVVRDVNGSVKEEAGNVQGVVREQKKDAGHSINITKEAATEEQEPKVTMWTLLTHYNKENAEAYKRQKQEKKKNENTVKTKEEYTGRKKDARVAFKVPGQQIEGISSVADKRNKNPQTQANGPLQQPPATEQPRNDYLEQSPYTADTAPKPQQINVDWTQQASFGDTTVLGMETQAGDTTVLSSAMISQPRGQAYLIRKKTNEHIPVNREVFKIGKEKSYADYFIGDNTAISRSHANIIKNQDGYFIIDTNSKNHTYVNGDVIQSNEPVALASGSTIQLANEEFDFIIE